MKRAKAQRSGAASRRSLAVAFFAPLLALVAGTFATGSKPPLAAASNPLDAQTTVDLSPIELPQSDADSVQRTAWLLEQRSVPNPLYYPPSVEIEPTVEAEDEPPVRADPAQPAPFVVTAMLRGRDGSARAVIDGALYDAGDEIAPNWVIIEINPTRRHVSVRKPDGTTLLLPMQTLLR